MSDESKAKAGGDDAAATSPLETLTSLVLDAADAANDSAQSTQEAIKRLTRVVETNEATTKAVRNAPAIFGAIMMSIGIIMAVVVAMVFSKLNERAAALDVAIAAQAEGLEKVERTLKDLAMLESNLEKFQKIADDTTQRAMVTLREQVKNDRLALQQLETRRLNEMLASLRGAVSTAPRSASSPSGGDSGRLAATKLESGKLADLEKSIARIDGVRLSAVESGIAKIDARLAAMEKSAKSGGGGAADTKRPVAVLSDAQAKDMKSAVAELGKLKTEVAALRELIEQRTSELQSGVPAIRRSGS
jgi:DNA repair exonuclease SbcCD ATPase subunit